MRVGARLRFLRRARLAHAAGADHRRVDAARTDGVHAHAARAVVEGEMAREPEQPRLAGRVRRPAVGALRAAGERRDVHDRAAAARRHAGQEGAAEIERPAQVHRQGQRSSARRRSPRGPRSRRCRRRRRRWRARRRGRSAARSSPRVSRTALLSATSQAYAARLAAGGADRRRRLVRAVARCGRSTATRAPSLASSSAVARPMPLAAPVTAATRSVKRLRDPGMVAPPPHL